MQRFTKPGIPVVDACAETSSVTKGCMLLPKHRKFISCKVDPGCATGARLQLILLFGEILLSKELNIDGEEQVPSSAEMYMKAVESMEVRRRLRVWEVPEGIRPIQTFLPHILYHLTTYSGKEKLLRKAKNVTAY